MVLPLRLTAFERYMLEDDRARYPMAFTIRLVFSGRLDPSSFRAALVTAVKRHPLLAAHIKGSGGTDLHWVFAADAFPYLDIAECGVPMEFPGSGQIDLRQQTGLRVWVRRSPEQTEMRFQFHHSCTDGVGAYRFLEDVLLAYHAAVQGDVARADFRPLEPVRLAERDRFGLTVWMTVLRLFAEVWGALIGSATFFLRRPQRLAASEGQRADRPTGQQLLDMPARTLSQQQTARYMAAAKADGVKLNDLLVHDVLRASHTWNRSHGRWGIHPVRVAVPVDLRTADDATLPACNVVAMVFIDRWVPLYGKGKSLLRTIRREMALIKRFRLALSFIRVCRFVGRIPGGMRFLTLSHRCYSTTVMSNMGRPLSQAPLPHKDGKLVAGELTVKQIESAPPVRPHTATGFTALTYAGRLTLVMNYDRYHFSPGGATAFLDHVVEQMLASAGIRDASAQPQAPTDRGAAGNTAAKFAAAAVED